MVFKQLPPSQGTAGTSIHGGVFPYLYYQFQNFTFASIEEKTLNQMGFCIYQAGITEDFDYLELSSFPLSSSSHDPETPKQLLVDDQA